MKTKQANACLQLFKKRHLSLNITLNFSRKLFSDWPGSRK